MSEKVKLPKEVAEAIENTRRFNSDQYIVYECLKQGDDFRTIPNIDADILIRALYIGYEVEHTPEDKVREYYSELTVKAKEKDYWDKFGVNLYRSEMQGIINSLRLLNIKISGVNEP